MPLQPALPGECLRHDIDPEVSFAPRAMASVTRMLMGFIDDPQAFRAESLGQLSCDEVLDADGLDYAGSCAGVNRPQWSSARNESKPFVKLAAGRVRSA